MCGRRWASGALGLWALWAACSALGARSEGPRYAFYRDMGAHAAGAGGVGGTRRVFGGAAAALRECPGACALLDRYWAGRCSGAVVAPRWALTAAHCVSPRLAYVRYNTHRPADPAGEVAAVLYLYRHPGYRVVQEDEGRGPDVTLLHHDVGLVRTRRDMALSAAPLAAPLAALRRYGPVELHNREVRVLGFGRTERGAGGEELLAVRLTVVFCERGAWFHCVCGRGGAGGVCAGDSGGPVLYRGTQVGVTSMGPVECAGGGGDGGSSVFTALQPYAALINATMEGAEAALRMRRVPAAAPPHHHQPSAALLLALCCSLGAHYIVR